MPERSPLKIQRDVIGPCLVIPVTNPQGDPYEVAVRCLSPTPDETPTQIAWGIGVYPIPGPDEVYVLVNRAWGHLAEAVHPIFHTPDEERTLRQHQTMAALDRLSRYAMILERERAAYHRAHKDDESLWDDPDEQDPPRMEYPGAGD